MTQHEQIAKLLTSLAEEQEARYFYAAWAFDLASKIYFHDRKALELAEQFLNECRKRDGKK